MAKHSIINFKYSHQIPDHLYPFMEDALIEYIVGYYVGTSFRSLMRCNDFNKALQFAESEIRISDGERKVEILLHRSYLQKIYSTYE